MAKTTITSSGSVTLENGGTVKVNIPGGGNVLVNGSPQGGIQEINIDFQNNPASDHVTINLSSFSQGGLKIDMKNYNGTDQVTLQGATIKGLVPGSNNQLAFSYVGANGVTYTGTAKIKGPNNFTSPNKPLVICFTSGTLIRTKDGESLIEDLSCGDLLETMHNGFQPIRWIGRRNLTGDEFTFNKHIRPIRINAGALGPNLPVRDTLVSPQHRMMLQGALPELLFGASEVLVAARHLVNDLSIRCVEKPGPITYFHLLFDSHQVIFANDAPAESLHPGVEAMSALDAAARDEVLAIFPELEALSGASRKTALPVLKSHEARVLEQYSQTVSI